jgi:hypothetical protein
MLNLSREEFISLRCKNVNIGHGTRGHQLEDGRFFASGDYVSKFSIEKNRLKILNRVYFRFHHLLERLAFYTVSGEDPVDAAIRIHRDDVLKGFFSQNEDQGFTGFQRTTFCISCLFGPAHHTLSCGHTFCTDCIKSYGRRKTKTIIEIDECLLHSDPGRRRQTQSIYIRPDDSGMRILCLDE